MIKISPVQKSIFNVPKIIGVFVFLSLFLSYTAKSTFAVDVCGQSTTDVNLFPINNNSNGTSGNDGSNPMLEVNTYFADPNVHNQTPHTAAPQYRSVCNTKETYRIMNDGTNVELEWNPKIINYGYQSWNLVYQIAWFRLNNAPNSCVSGFGVINNPLVKFPQTLMGVRGQFVENIPSWGGNNANIKQLNHRFVMKDNAGGTLPDGWYQVDIMPGCQTKGGITWETNKSIGAFFIRLQCTNPGSIRNPSVALNGTTGANLFWQAPTAPSGQQRADVVTYTVLRQEPTGGNFNPIATVSGMPPVNGQFIYNDTGLSCNSTYYYQIKANGCQNKSSLTNTTLKVTTPACNCSITDPSNAYCANIGVQKQISVDGVSNPDVGKLVTNPTGGSFSNVSGNANRFNMTPPTIGSSPTTVNVSYNSNQCNANFTVYTPGKINVQIQRSVNGCSNTSVLDGIPGKTVSYVDEAATGLPGASGTTPSTDDNGNVVVTDLPVRNQNSSSCNTNSGKLTYQIKIDKTQLESGGFTVCSDSIGSGKWQDAGAYFVYTTTGFNDANPVINAPDIYFEQFNDSASWINVSQGNFVISESGLNMQTTGTDKVITNDGSLITLGSIQIPTGTLGNSGNHFYSIEGYDEGFESNLTKILNLDSSKYTSGSNATMVASNDCNTVPSQNPGGSKHILYLSDCDLTIDSNNKIHSKYDLVIVKNGNVTFTDAANHLKQSYVIGGDLIVNSHNQPIDVDGYIWVKDSIDINRKLNINSKLEYINSDLYKSVLDTSVVHNVNFD